MCRYSDPHYRTSFVCLPCRHVAQYDTFHDGPVHPCPLCRVPMVNMGRDFKAPRKSADPQWEKLRILVASGVRFDSCGCDGPGPRPRTLGDARRDDFDVRHGQPVRR